MNSNALDNAAGDGAPLKSTGGVDLDQDMPYSMLGPVSRVYVSESAWQDKTRAQRQETLDLEPKLIEAAIQQQRESSVQAAEAQAAEARAQAAINRADAEAAMHILRQQTEVTLRNAQASSDIARNFRFDGHRVVKKRETYQKFSF